MSKTFKSSYSDRTITAIRVGDEFAVNLGGDGIRVISTTKGNHCGIELSRDDAPALALAIIDEAYPTGDYVLDGSPEAFLAVAREYLGKASRAIESKAKEAADREALEAEALELLNAVRASNGNASVDSLDRIAGARDSYLTVASKAREIHKAKS